MAEKLKIGSSQIDDEAEHFYYLSKPEQCLDHYHLKCKRCGRIYHLDCPCMKNLEEHIKKEHNFLLDRSDNVLYGKCMDCEERQKNEKNNSYSNYIITCCLCARCRGRS